MSCNKECGGNVSNGCCGGNGFLIIIVLYILLAIILGACLY